jgi:hypothetical protein
MSIFQIKEWWATSVGSNEEFDTGSVDLHPLDDSTEPKIITGKVFTNLLKALLKVS